MKKLDKKEFVKIGILLACFMVYLFSFVSRLSWSVVMPTVAGFFNMNSTQSGSYMTIFYVGYIITQFPGGLLADRFGYRKVLLFSFMILGIFTALMGISQNYEEGFRFITGLGSGAIFSSGMSAIFRNFSSKSRTVASTIFLMAPTLGTLVVNILIPPVSMTYGWRFSFFVAGALPIIGFILSFLLLRESPIDNENTTGKEKKNLLDDIKCLLTNSKFILILLSGSFASASLIGFTMWANVYLNKEVGISLVKSGQIMATYGILSLFLCPLIGKYCDLHREHRKIILTFILALLSLFIILFTLNKNVNMFYLIVPIIGVFSVFLPLMATLVGELVESRLVGTATGLANTIWQLGVVICPILVGIVLDATSRYFYAFLLMASFGLISSLFILFINDNHAKIQSSMPLE